jgi:hypothetical protein
LTTALNYVGFAKYCKAAIVVLEPFMINTKCMNLLKKGKILCQTSELLLLIAMVEESISNEAESVPHSLVLKLASCSCSPPFNNRETPKDKLLSKQTEHNFKIIIN